MVRRGKSGEQEKQGQGIIQIAESIDEGRVTLLDDMVQGESWGMILLKARSVADFTTTQGTSDLLRDSLLVTELVQQRLMEEVLDVLRVVKGGVGRGGLRGLLLVPGLTRVNSLIRKTN